MKPLFTVLSLFLILSCTQLSQEEKDIKENLNKTVKLDMFDTVRKGDTTLTYSEWREQYEYISLVYMEVGCNPCYDNFIEWQTAMDTISPGNDYTVLFIIQGEGYEKFMRNVYRIDSTFVDKFFSVTDVNYQFVSENIDIPEWIINSSVMIDKKDRIKLIGAPYKTPQMTKLFYEILGV